jgi:2-amino-4-hydroxy-6-hydroxymethyldihydropteridine diphosphokinase
MDDWCENEIVALGGNVASTRGAPAQTLHLAVSKLAEAGFAIRCVSRFFRTPCFPAGAGPDYVNAAVCLNSPWDTGETLARLHQIEAAFGRERRERWGVRTLDLDLVASGASVVPDVATYERWRGLSPDLQAKAVPDQLILPHPRLQDRAFVLVPLVDIAPMWRHPVLGRSAADLLATLPPEQVAEVQPI